MSQASKPIGSVGRVAFELDRFELVGGDHFELEGRWSGVRGRRFMRPALAVVVDGQSKRLLADLADKPWPAEDGEPWSAGFPFALEGGELLEAELTVAPDITVALPLPAAQIRAGKMKPQSGRAKRPRPSAARADGERRRLQRELDHLESEKAEAASRMDELLGQLRQVALERDAALAARDQLAADLEAASRERDRFAAERDAARRERDEAVRARDTARADCDRAQVDRGNAIAAQARAESERDAAIAARDQAASERSGALALRDHALAERDSAVTARDEAVYRSDALSATSERLQSELANLSSTRGAAMVMRRAVQEPPASRFHPPVLATAIGIIVVLAIAIVLLVALRGF